MKTLTTAALFLDIRVVETKAFIQAFLGEIQLCPVKIDQTLGIDKKLHTAAFENMVLGSGLIDIFKNVGQTRTTGRLHSEPDAKTLAPTIKAFPDMLHCSIGECYGHNAITL